MSAQPWLAPGVRGLVQQRLYTLSVANSLEATEASHKKSALMSDEVWRVYNFSEGLMLNFGQT